MPRNPAIVVATLPKSGTMYINARLQDILGERYQMVMAKAGRWPRIAVHEPSIRYMVAHGGQYTVGHIPATPVNLADLHAFGLPRILVHLRDPRQAILSWTHWIDRSHRERPLLPHEIPDLTDYFERPFPERLSWQIDNQFPHFVAFLENWIQVAEADQPPLEVKLSRFSLMKTDPAAFFRELLDFFHVPDVVIPPDLARGHSPSEHFRKGLEDEWKSVFTPEQRARADAALAPQLRAHLDTPAAS